MAHDTHIYGEVNSKTGMKKVFTEIRHDVEFGQIPPSLTELYRRAGYLITLTHAPSWEENSARSRAASQRRRRRVRHDGAQD